jgi:hypothetical protein
MNIAQPIKNNMLAIQDKTIEATKNIGLTVDLFTIITIIIAKLQVTEMILRPLPTSHSELQMTKLLVKPLRKNKLRNKNMDAVNQNPPAVKVIMGIILLIL